MRNQGVGSWPVRRARMTPDRVAFITDGRTETYSWDGSYYFDKAKGAGGAYVENFTINNQSGDPTALPGFPEEWKPYFGYGRGGVHSTGIGQKGHHHGPTPPAHAVLPPASTIRPRRAAVDGPDG